MKQKILLAIMGAFVVLVPVFVFAATSGQVFAQGTTTPNCTTDCPQSGLEGIKSAFPNQTTTSDTVPELAKKIINWALYFSAIIAVIFIIIGGFMYVTSAGDQAKAGKGRATLVNALIGLVIIVLSFLIVQVVYNFLIGR